MYARKMCHLKMFWLALGILKSKPRNSLIQLQVEKVKKKLNKSWLLPNIHMMKERNMMIMWLYLNHEAFLTPVPFNVCF